MPQKTPMIHPRQGETRPMLSKLDASSITTSALSKKRPLIPERSPFFEESTLRLEPGKLVPTTLKNRSRQLNTIFRICLYDLGADWLVQTGPVFQLFSPRPLTTHFLSNCLIFKASVCIDLKQKKMPLDPHKNERWTERIQQALEEYPAKKVVHSLRLLTLLFLDLFF